MEHQKKRLVIVPRELQKSTHRCSPIKNDCAPSTWMEHQKKRLVIVPRKPSQNGIVLFDYQIGHVRKLQKILERSFFALDLSMLGTGKTYTAATVAIEGKYRHIIVIAPPSVKTKWLQLVRDYNLPITAIIGYQELRSVKGSQPKHGLLSRRDMPDGTVEFHPTERLKTYVADGAIIIIDEIQNIKNNTAQFQACSSLVHCVAAAFPTRNSRALFISGSPIDKREQILNFYRCIRAYTCREMCIYNPVDDSYHITGFRQIVDFCAGIDEEARAFAEAELGPLRRRGMGLARTCMEASYSLFIRYVKQLSSEMPPVKYDAEIIKLNGFFKIAEHEKDRLIEAVSSLARACAFNEEQQCVDYGRDGISEICKAMRAIELAKLSLFIRLVKSRLRDTPESKVVIAVNYTDSLLALKAALWAYRPLIMNGATSTAERMDVLRLFQTASLEHRLLICNVSVCSTGIDLDDKNGAYPRFCYVSPMYNTITLYQLSHRFLRADTRSSSTMYMVYAAGDDCRESRIMRALSKKSLVMKETTSGQADAGVLFPGDFPGYVEE
jgi:superfamily II DNA or RNA helicase